jgi:carbon-monoxide dehydrogenase medium subunit
VKARAFDYQRVVTIEGALAAHAACRGEARFLAGGQSLLPVLNLRLDAPDLLIDIAHIPDLRGIVLQSSVLRVGALTRHNEVLRSSLIAEHAPLLTQAAAFVAHPAIRNQGTIGGSIALADPASEFPACMRALNARMEIAGPKGIRTVVADVFFQGLYQTALAQGELLTALLVPAVQPGQRMRFDELGRRRGDYALAGVAANLTIAAHHVTAARLAFCAAGATAMRAPTAEAALISKPLTPDTVRAAQAGLDQDLDPFGDDDMPAATRLHLARVLLGRVLTTLGQGA